MTDHSSALTVIFSGRIIGFLYFSSIILLQKQLISKRKNLNVKQLNSSYEELIGNTNLICCEYLSSLIQRRILLKMENMNPGGSGKDRAAKFMVEAALQQKNDVKIMVEGTSGSGCLTIPV